MVVEKHSQILQNVTIYKKIDNVNISIYQYLSMMINDIIISIFIIDRECRFAIFVNILVFIHEDDSNVSISITNRQ